MYCKYCGKQNANDVKFCYSCGKPINTVNVAPVKVKTEKEKIDTWTVLAIVGLVLYAGGCSGILGMVILNILIGIMVFTKNPLGAIGACFVNVIFQALIYVAQYYTLTSGLGSEFEVFKENMFRDFFAASNVCIMLLTMLTWVAMGIGIWICLKKGKNSMRWIIPAAMVMVIYILMIVVALTSGKNMSVLIVYDMITGTFAAGALAKWSARLSD